MKFALPMILACSVGAYAQSGRVKRPENPAPTPKPSQRAPVKYTPTLDPAELLRPLPSPTPKPANDNEVIKVESTLVPIPATVLDANGRVLSTLNLEDFELQVNGKAAEISELSRSESPIRLAMLFDNSSSVLVAREFEVKAAVGFFDRMLRPDKDLAALFSISTYSRLEQPLTGDVRLLTRSIEMFPSPEGATALLDGIIKAAEYLGEVRGRRVMVIVSDGDDTYSESTLEQRSEEHTSELQSRLHLVCRLLLEKKKKKKIRNINYTNNTKNSQI